MAPETREPLWSCVMCGYEMDTVSPVHGVAVPREGSIALCMNCAARYVRRGAAWSLMTVAELGRLSLAEQRELFLATEVVRGLPDLRRGRA